jgi:chorismate synthase
MNANAFGDKFKISISGASHDDYMSVAISGMSKGISIDYDLIDYDLSRRRPKYAFDTPRIEKDEYIIVSGEDNGTTTGEEIKVVIKNKSIDNKPYTDISNIYRPSHADYTWEVKTGQPLSAGGGILSARETVLRVIAGAFAKMLLKEKLNNMIEFYTWVHSVGEIFAPDYEPEISSQMQQYLTKIKTDGDSIGGSVRCVVKHIPAGIGEPVFNKIHAVLAYALMSIPAAKAFEVGRGVEASFMKGSEHNDPYKYDETEHKIIPAKNDAGGVLGGITTGEDIILTVYFKPISSILKEQHSVDKDGKPVSFSVGGRHDVCAAIRAVAVVEAMTAIVIANFI